MNPGGSASTRSPWLIQTSSKAGSAAPVVRDAVQQPGRGRAPHLRVAELAVRGRRDPAAELRGHGLHAVADAEHRHAELEHGVRRARRHVVRDRLRAAGEDDAARAEPADGVVAAVPGQDFAVDADLAHAPRDQLRVLRAEVEDQDPVGVDVGRGSAGMRAAISRSGSSALLS